MGKHKRKKNRVNKFTKPSTDCVDACALGEEKKPIIKMETSIPKLILSVLLALSGLLMSCQENKKEYPQEQQQVLMQDSLGNVYQQQPYQEQYSNQNNSNTGLNNVESGLLGAAAGAAAGYYLGNKNNRPSNEYYNDNYGDNRLHHSSGYNGSSRMANNSGIQQKKTIIINKYYGSKDGTSIKNPQIRPKIASNGFKPSSSTSNNRSSGLINRSSIRTSSFLDNSQKPKTKSNYTPTIGRSSFYSSSGNSSSSMSSRRSGFFSGSRRGSSKRR